MKLLKPFTQQFKTFLAKTYTKPFIVICLIVIGIGAVNSSYTVSNLKDSIETQLAQREKELNKLFAEKDKQAEVVYQAELQKHQQCIEEYKKEHPWVDGFDLSLSYRTGCGQPFRVDYSGSLGGYFEDSSYRELTRIKNTSSFQLFFEKFGFGWWGIIALVAVFIINILIILVKFLQAFIPMIIRASNGQVVLTKNNINNMPVFQKYLLLIAILILATLVFILIKL